MGIIPGCRIRLTAHLYAAHATPAGIRPARWKKGESVALHGSSRLSQSKIARHYTRANEKYPAWHGGEIRKVHLKPIEPAPPGCARSAWPGTWPRRPAGSGHSGCHRGSHTGRNLC